MTDKATAKFQEGYNCAQAVLFAHGAELGLDDDTALRLACGFGAGVARRQGVCGAVSGGILVLGLRHGRGTAEDLSATELTYAKTQALLDQFHQRHGSVNCRELLDGCDLSTPEGRAAFTERELKASVCMPCVESVVAILEDLR